MSPSSSTGGAAAAGGTTFEARVAGWYGVHMLAESGAPAVPGQASTARVEYLRCQSGEAVDDILVGFSDGGHDFVQAKRSLSLEVDADSKLAKSIGQCVRQVIGSRREDRGVRPWNRRLDPTRDRLVLAVGASSSKSIREDLATVLRRVPHLRPEQPLTDAAVNTAESKALAVVLDHAGRTWKVTTGNDATDDDLRTLLSLLSVLELDVDPGGANEREALLLLRNAVVLEPTHDAAAWHIVWSTTAQLAQDQSGLDRRGLEKTLRDAVIRMRGVRSYEHDVHNLKAASAQALALIERFASFESGGAVIKLPRGVAETIGTLATHDSFAIVGEPGAGKSAALFEAAAVPAPNTAVLVLQAVDLGCRNLAELRQQLDLEHNLVEVLDNWRDADVGVLFIDALDAARDEASVRTLRDLMDLVLKKPPRWRVVASIRSFDLKQGTQYQHVFRGSLPALPTEYQRSEFAHARHVFVPRLSDQELADLAVLAPLLRPLIESASGPLKELLRIPFNIQLLAQLVDDGAALTALQPLRTQVELLDLYWSHRVRRDAQADARESLLRRICEQMVGARQLRVERATLSLDSTESTLLHDLLSAHVLIEVESPHTRVLTFSHHVLFDYAAARLLLPVEPEDLVAYLASDPSLVFVLRPSLVLAFHERWRRSRQAFWATTLRLIADDRIEAVGEVIGPVTAVDLATSDDDWDAVFEALAGPDPATQAAAAKALQYVVGSLLAGSMRPMVGPGAGPWAVFAERIAASLRPDLASALRVLLYHLTEKDDQMTEHERASAGRAARLLSQFAQRELPNNRNLITASIALVARTSATDPAASMLVLRRCLEPDRVQQFGYEELPALARNVQHLIADPAFVADLYAVTFSFTEKSKDATAMGGSAILLLRSNRAQDYEGAYYALAKTFPAFFEVSPVHATDAIVRAVDAYVQEKHPGGWASVEEETFTLGDALVRVRTDYSEIWDKTPHDDAQQLLIVFEKGLVDLADAGASQTLQDVLAVVVGKNRTAAVWRRLFRAGAQRPDTFGVLLAPLLQRSVFLAHDTSRAAARLAQAVYPHLAASEREKLEETLLSLPGAEEVGKAARERLRDECVASLPQELLQRRELRDLAGRLATATQAGGDAVRRLSAAADNGQDDDEDPDEEDFAGSMRWLDPKDAMLQMEGVNVRDEANAHLRSLASPVQAFVDKHMNTEPGQDEVEQILPEIARLEDGAKAADTSGVHARVLELARVVLAEAYSVIVKCGTLPSEHMALQRARPGLLRAAISTSPELDDEYESNWDTDGSGWGPADRIEAAQGLLYLARRKETCDAEVLDAIETLAADPVAAVRYQIAPNLNFLYYTARERMWIILERRLADEQRGGVAKALLGSLEKLTRADEERVAGVAIQLSTRFAAHKEVARSSTKLLAAMWIWRGTTGTRAHIENVIANVGRAPEVAGAILHVIRKPLAHGALDDQEAAAVRARAFDVTKQLVAKTLDVYRSRIEGQDFSGRGEAEVANARSIVGIIDGAARELYFASGANDESEGPAPVDEARQRRFYVEAAGIIDLLIATGLPPATHSLVEMFESMIDLQPTEVFFRIRDLIRAGHVAGYSQEDLAIDLVVRIVERYLADYRHLFQASAELRAALSEILNLFIAAGWPQALRLASRLEDIFR